MQCLTSPNPFRTPSCCACTPFPTGCADSSSSRDLFDGPSLCCPTSALMLLIPTRHFPCSPSPPVQGRVRAAAPAMAMQCLTSPNPFRTPSCCACTPSPTGCADSSSSRDLLDGPSLCCPTSALMLLVPTRHFPCSPSPPVQGRVRAAAPAMAMQCLTFSNPSCTHSPLCLHLFSNRVGWQQQL